MTYGEWEKQAPTAINNDPLWRPRAYRPALFVADLGWHETTKLVKDCRTVSLSDPLCRASGSIGANLAERYSRGSGKDRARFYQNALGSARESRTWYFNGRHLLGELVANHRMEPVAQLRNLLLTMIPDERGYTLHEEAVSHVRGVSEPLPPFDLTQFQVSLDHLPLP